MHEDIRYIYEYVYTYTYIHIYTHTHTCAYIYLHIYLPNILCFVSTLWLITHDTGCRIPIGCLKLQVIFRKRATNYKALLRKMTYKHKASYGSSPPCTTFSIYILFIKYLAKMGSHHTHTHTHTHTHIHTNTYTHALRLGLKKNHQNLRLFFWFLARVRSLSL